MKLDAQCFDAVWNSLRLVGSDERVHRARRCKRRATVWGVRDRRGRCAQHFAQWERRRLKVYGVANP